MFTCLTITRVTTYRYHHTIHYIGPEYFRFWGTSKHFFMRTHEIHLWNQLWMWKFCLNFLWKLMQSSLFQKKKCWDLKFSASIFFKQSIKLSFCLEVLVKFVLMLNTVKVCENATSNFAYRRYFVAPGSEVPSILDL